jgi:tetratricopeptide (TPR) repeat protein
LLLLFLLAVSQGATERGAVRPQYDLGNYLAVAAAYGSANYPAALREIRQWRAREIEAAVAGLRRQGRSLRSVPTAPNDIAFGTVEAAVLMHAEAGLLSLEAQSPAEAEFHLRASTTLLVWSREAAAEARNWAEARRNVFHKRFPQKMPPPETDIRERIDRGGFYMAVAAAALAIGFADTAHPFAEKAREFAPLDPEVQMVSGCAAEVLAAEQILRHRDSEAAALREKADAELRDALALDGGLLEARLRLGKLHLDRGRLIEAEPLLHAVAERSGDDRQRYLARLFLGRLAERRERLDEAAGFYLRALEAWPDSQAAHLGLAHAVEKTSGPAAALPLVAASLAASRVDHELAALVGDQGRSGRAADPWWLYFFGPPGLAKATLDRVWMKALDR